MTLLGALLIPLSFGLLCQPLISGEERFGILFFFILLWTNDSMAYVTGRLLGRHKLWERISPKKTWEGFFGGVIFAMIVSYLAHARLGLNLIDALSFAFLVGVFGTLGDLLESSLKRKVGVKDSGSILPGHGGILDRFDGVMLAAPMVFFYLTFVNRG
jgi:phosphatidate cytidylyltransferase